LWGSGDFVHWWNRDGGRLKKNLALVIDTGRHVRPTITPDDPETVERILTDHLSRGAKPPLSSVAHGARLRRHSRTLAQTSDLGA
jgi:hypothetical protein